MDHTVAAFLVICVIAGVNAQGGVPLPEQHLPPTVLITLSNVTSQCRKASEKCGIDHVDLYVDKKFCELSKRTSPCILTANTIPGGSVLVCSVLETTVLVLAACEEFAAFPIEQQYFMMFQNTSEACQNKSSTAILAESKNLRTLQDLCTVYTNNKVNITTNGCSTAEYESMKLLTCSYVPSNTTSTTTTTNSTVKGPENTASHDRMANLMLMAAAFIMIPLLTTTFF